MGEVEQTSIALRLGDATYAVRSEQLFGPSGEEIFLRAQSAAVLGFLAARGNVLVSREDLMAAVWPDIAVTDDSLTQCIRDIRIAIGDRERKLLVTIPKRGFRLKAVPSDPEAAATRTPDIASSVWTAGGGAIAAVANNDDVIDAHSDEAQTGALAQLDPRDVQPTVAILPFRGEELGDSAVFGIFLADEIARQLGLGEDVNVVSRLSTGTMGGRLLGLEEIGARLNADFVLSGHMIRSGSAIAVSLELAETETRFAIWSDRIQFPYDPAMQRTEGVELIIAHIRHSIMLNEARRVRSRPLSDLKLFSILHGAIGLLHRFAPRDFALAKDYLEHVHEKAPMHPAPLAWMARWHVLKTVQGWTDDPKREADAALRQTSRALDIDPEHTLALVCEGQVRVHLARDLEGGEACYDAAIKNNPNDANGRALRGMLHAFTDRGPQGKRDAELALHLTPLDPHRFFYLALASGVCISAGDFDRAVALAKESLRLNRSHVSTVRMLAVAQLGSGDEESAQRTTAELMTLQPDLRVSEWMRAAPSAAFQNGRQFAEMLRALGVPE